MFQVLSVIYIQIMIFVAIQALVFSIWVLIWVRFLAPLIVGTIGLKYNFHLGFGLAAIGMAIGLIVFLANEETNILV